MPGQLTDGSAFVRLSRAATAVTATLTLLLAPLLVGRPAHAADSDHAAVAQRGVVRSSASYLPGRQLASDGHRVPEPATPTQRRDTPQDEAFKQQCASQDTALDESGWFRDRYSQCTRRTWIITVFANRVPVGTVTSNITMLGFGSNGSREIRYVVYVENIRKVGAPNLVLETLQIQVSFAGCDPSVVRCPVLTGRDATVTAWKLQDDWEITFASPDVAGGGEQRVPQSLYLRLWAHSPQPDFIFDPPFDSSTSRSRYDSASYVGATRGAVFTDHQLVFTVDLRDPTQDESALHILDAQTRPDRTFPSWVGKSVPGRTEPLKRLYTPDGKAKEANRTKSVALCEEIWGKYDGNIQNCDEYPFASTYQGAATGAPEPDDLQRYSVRVIDAADNIHVGRDLLENQFYKGNRVLDGDLFLVRVNT